MNHPKKFSTLLGAVSILLVAGAASAHDHSGHSHKEKGHSHEHADAKVVKDTSVAAVPAGPALAKVDSLLGQLEKGLAAGSVDDVHAIDEGIQAAVKDLDKDASLTAAKRKRVQGYVKNILRMAHKMHNFAHDKKLAETKKEAEKLKAQIGLLKKQFEKKK